MHARGQPAASARAWPAASWQLAGFHLTFGTQSRHDMYMLCTGLWWEEGAGGAKAWHHEWPRVGQRAGQRDNARPYHGGGRADAEFARWGGRHF